MGGELVLSTATLLGFLVTLARVTGVFVFVPLPGLTSGFAVARTVLSLSMTVALFPYWPHLPADLSAGLLTVWMISEAALGMGIGLSVAFVTEGFNVAAQIMGLQAGYAYASTVDPNTQADSTVLVLLVQLAAGMLFFAMGLDREVIRIFVRSMEAGASRFVRTYAGHGPAVAFHGRRDVFHRRAAGLAGGRDPFDGGHFAGPAGARERPTATTDNRLSREDDGGALGAWLAHAADPNAAQKRQRDSLLHEPVVAGAVKHG